MLKIDKILVIYVPDGLNNESNILSKCNAVAEVTWY